MADFPALPLWTDAYLGDTRHLTTLEHGAYLLLMMTAWRTPDCRLPDNDKLLARWAGLGPRQWQQIKPQVMQFWHLDEGHWVQKRLSKEAVWVRKSATANKERASLGGKAKALKDRAKPLLEADEKHASGMQPTPTPTPTPKVEGKEHSSKTYYFTGSVVRLTREDFDRWAAAFPAIFDLKAELTSIDAWLASQPDGDRKWFHRTAGMLNKRQQALAKEAAAPDAGGEHVARVGF